MASGTTWRCGGGCVHRSFGWRRCAQFVLVAAATLLATAAEAAVRFVNAAAPAGGDGLSWATAYRDLEVALDAAQASGGTVTEIWVAQGTYKPSQLQSAGDPLSAYFRLLNGVAIRGGFVGNETDAAQADPAAHPTILSGDIGVAGVDTDNAAHVIIANNVNASGVLDGFVITGGRAVGNWGGGLLIGGSSSSQEGPIIEDCVILGNTAGSPGASGGGGAWIGVKCQFLRVRFQDNHTPAEGAGAYVSASTTFTDCEFIGNTMTGDSAGNGGGLRCTAPLVTLVGCTFSGNYSFRGGGLQSTGGLAVSDCVFLGNAAVISGGACQLEGSGPASFTRSRFESNAAPSGSGGISSSRTDPLKLVSCAFLRNTGQSGAGVIDAGAGSVYAGCLFAGNAATSAGGGLYKYGGALTVTNCTVVGNSAATASGGIGGSAVVTGRNLVLWGNTLAGASSEAAQFKANASSTVSYSCVQSLAGQLGGSGNIGADPLFVDMLGPDGLHGSGDEDLRLGAGSPCVDAGSNPLVAADVADLDADGDLVEWMPFDLAEADRLSDDPAIVDTGVGPPPVVDMGAYEREGVVGSGGTYVGPPGGSWFVASNWLAGVVPGPKTEVLIGTLVVIDAPGAVAGSIEVQAAGGLAVGAGSLTADSLTVAEGGSFSLGEASSLVEIGTATLAKGASLAWAAGTMSISTSLAVGSPLEVGCLGPAALELQGGATVEAPAMTLCGNGALRGTGTILPHLVAQGTIAPGFSAGALTLAGGATLDGASAEIELGGYAPGTFDQLVVAAPSEGDATIVVSLLPSFSTALGGMQEIVSGLGTDAVEWQLALPSLGKTYALVAQTPVARIRLVTSLLAPVERIHVDVDAANGGDGVSWGTALQSLDAALAVAATGMVGEVWVAEGRYVPSVEWLDGDQRSKTFAVPDGLHLYGSFAGTETSPAERDIAGHPTVLSGDHLGNDQPAGTIYNPTMDDNSYHVLRLTGCGAATLVDGFTAQDGNANVNPSNPDAEDSEATDSGGGVLIESGAPVVRHLRATKNRVWREGAGLAVRSGTALIEESTFEGNFATGNQSSNFGQGSGVSVAAGADVTINNSLFRANDVSSAGMAAAVYVGGHASLTGCEIREHTSSRLVAFIDGSVDLVSCQFNDNTTVWGGMGACVSGIRGSSHIEGCTFDGNLGTAGGAIGNAGGLHEVVACTFTSNSATEGAGIWIAAGDLPLPVTIADCTFQGNVGAYGAGAHVKGSMPVVFLHSTFVGNAVSQSGGAVFCRDFATPVLVDCSIEGNSASLTGGGIHLFNNGKLTLDNTTLAANAAPDGSGIYNDRSTVIGGFSLAQGDDLFNASSLRPGALPPQPLVETLSIDGDFRQVQVPGAGSVTPTLVMDIAGYRPGIDHDRLVVGGEVELAGTLVLNFAADFTPLLGDSFDLITGASVSGQFDAVGVSAAGSLGVSLSYSGGIVRATVTQASPPSFTDPLLTDLTGLPTDLVVTDVDLDGDLDLAISVEASASLPGKVLVLRNGGVDTNGQWVGFENEPLAVGIVDGPVAIAAGDLGGDDGPEFVTANGDSSTASAVLNYGGLFFFLDQTYQTGLQASGVAIGQFVGDAGLDFAISNEISGGVRLYRNEGPTGFTLTGTLTAGAKPAKLASADVDLDGDDDLIVANTSDFANNPPPLVTIHRSNGNGTFAPAESYPIGRKTSAMVVADLNGDGLVDIVTGNRLDYGISLLVADAANPGHFLPTVPLTLVLEPFSLRPADVDLDGDLDIVGVLKPILQGPRLQIIRNDTPPGGPVTLTLGDVIPTQTTPEFAAAADVDGDGDEDLLVVSYLSGAADSQTPSARLAVILSDAAPNNPADLNHDGHVNATDLALLLGAWNTPGPGDLDDSGLVGPGDLAILLGAWGS